MVVQDSDKILDLLQDLIIGLETSMSPVVSTTSYSLDFLKIDIDMKSFDRKKRLLLHKICLRLEFLMANLDGLIEYIAFLQGKHSVKV